MYAVFCTIPGQVIFSQYCTHYLQRYAEKLTRQLNYTILLFITSL